MFYLHNERNRMFYRSKNLTEGLEVKGYFILPLDHIATSLMLSFIEIGGGIYYLDHSFEHVGKYGLIVHENGVAKHFETFKVG